MRVLAAIVAPPHLSVSGGARAGEQLSAALASSCDITVANMMSEDFGEATARDARRPSRVPVKTSLPWPLKRIPFAKRLRALFYRSDIPQMIAGGHFDLIHIHNPMPALEMARIARACRAAGVPYVVSTHGFNEVANGRKIYGFDPLRQLAWKLLVERPVGQAVRGASAVFALSPADFDIVQAMAGPHVEMSIVANGVPSPSPADPQADGAVYQRLGIPAVKEAGTITCMFLANHTPNKGLPNLLAAFSAVRIPYLLIVGGEKRNEIDYQRAIASCGVGQSIVVTGRLQDADVGALFRRSDVFVFPTLADTFPLAVLEAMSHGVPVIASRVGGIPYQVDEACGLLVRPGDVGELADTVEALARDPSRRLEMGKNAQKRVINQFTWESAAKRALAGYKNVLTRTSHRSGVARSPSVATWKHRHVKEG